MSDVALRMEHVYKKFRKGEVYNSLRDLLPALTGKMFRQQELSATDKREFWALQDLSFEVKQGEAFGIIGHNGAGKSTALKILSRIMKPTKGRMVVNGRLSALIEVTAGFHQDLTGRENIFLHGTILGMSQKEIASKLDQIIAFSGLEDFVDTPVKRYSSGMFARLGFSVAAHVDPEVLIVDEVLSVGDFAFQQKCVQRMKEVIRSGATVLFVSHNLKTVGEFCNRCMLLERGRAVSIGPPEEVIQTYVGGTNGGRSVSEEQDVVISRITTRNQDGECQNFKAGDKAWVEVEVTARRRCQKLSVSLAIADSTDFMVCETSMERLGCGTFNVEAGETFRCTFELTLNLMGGVFRISSLIYRYDISKEYDRWLRAATLIVAYDHDVRGAANCFPRIVARELVAHQETAAECAVPVGGRANGAV